MCSVRAVAKAAIGPETLMAPTGVAAKSKTGTAAEAMPGSKCASLQAMPAIRSACAFRLSAGSVLGVCSLKRGNSFPA